MVVGTVTAGLSLACARLSNHATPQPPNKGDAGYRKFMIGAHLGLALPILFSGLFIWRASKVYGDPEKQYLVYLLGFLTVGSLGIFALLFAIKPKKAKKKKQ